MAKRQVTEHDVRVRLWQEWSADWNIFIRDVLGAELDEEQQAIVSAVQHNKMVSVRSGTARGKDFVSACICVAFMYLTPEWNANGEMTSNTKVAMTAPTGRQVANIMFPEISRLFNRAKSRGVELPGRLVGCDIRTNFEEWFLTGFKADEHNHEAWSGFHAANTMFVITEATGVADDTFEAIEGNLQGNSRILLVFNPNITTGYAARSQKSPRWKKFRLSSLSAPNVLQKKMIIPGQVDYEWVKDKVAAWCEPISEAEVLPSENDFQWEGRWYRPSDLFRRKVLGEFPKVDEDVLIPQAWIELANQRWQEYTLGSHNDGILGIDVAGMGRDSTVYCERYGSYVERIEKHDSGGKADHMKVAGRAIAYLRGHSGCTVSIDTIGEGAGVYSRCVEVAEADRKLNENAIVSCKYSEAAKRNATPLKDTTGVRTFANMRAFLFWAVRDWLNPDNHTGAMLPPDDELLEEATEIKWSFLSNGSIIIEPKEDIKERIGRSTDKFDALANTFHPKAITNVGYSELELNEAEEEDYEAILY